jgi:large subunit ribosomal protein L15
MQLHTLTKQNTPEKKRRIGRGGKRGKTSGHGHKGQKQHGRHGLRPEMRDFIKSLPKLRGHGKNRARTVNSGRPTVIEVKLSHIASFNSEITPRSLVEAGILSKLGNKIPHVKIINDNAELKNKLTIADCSVTASVRGLVEKSGGQII